MVKVQPVIDKDSGSIIAVELVSYDEVIASGSFGGEPEDNCESRDYSWVIPMLQMAVETENASCRARCLTICKEMKKRLYVEGPSNENYRSGVSEAVRVCCSEIVSKNYDNY